jgi:hypothetical protein
MGVWVRVYGCGCGCVCMCVCCSRSQTLSLRPVAFAAHPLNVLTQPYTLRLQPTMTHSGYNPQ